MYHLMTTYKIKKESAQQHTSLLPSYSQIKSFSKKCNFYLRINAEAHLSLRNSNVGLCQTVFNPKNSGIPSWNFQPITLHLITSVPFFVSNYSLYKDLNIKKPLIIQIPLQPTHYYSMQCKHTG